MDEELRPLVSLRNASKILMDLGYDEKTFHALQGAARREREKYGNDPHPDREYVWSGTRWYMRREKLQEYVRRAGG